jgi:hypothetical protein
MVRLAHSSAQHHACEPVSDGGHRQVQVRVCVCVCGFDRVPMPPIHSQACYLTVRTEHGLAQSDVVDELLDAALCTKVGKFGTADLVRAHERAAASERVRAQRPWRAVRFNRGCFVCSLDRGTSSSKRRTHAQRTL